MQEWDNLFGRNIVESGKSEVGMERLIILTEITKTLRIFRANDSRDGQEFKPGTEILTIFLCRSIQRFWGHDKWFMFHFF